MLTGFQVSTGAYMTEYGELLCEDCFDRGDTYAKPVSNYALDEWQSGSSDGYFDGEEGHAEDCYCEPALHCDDCGGELREQYTSPDCEEEDA